MGVSGLFLENKRSAKNEIKAERPRVTRRPRKLAELKLTISLFVPRSLSFTTEILV